MFRGDKWCFKHIVPADVNGWSWLIVAEGDVRDSIDKSYSPYTQKRLEVATILGKPHTVIRMRNGDIIKLKRAGGNSALRNCILKIMSEQDGRRFYPSVFKAADVVDEIRGRKTRRFNAIRDKKQFSADVRSAFSSRNTIRGAATDSI